MKRFASNSGHLFGIVPLGQVAEIYTWTVNDRGFILFYLFIFAKDHRFLDPHPHPHPQKHDDVLHLQEKIYIAPIRFYCLKAAVHYDACLF